MQLLDRYLQSVATFLPAKNREDILAELRANLTAEFEAREEATGAPLTEDAQADILRQHGHPMLVASQYFPQQPLIGTPWIATYWFVLKMALAVSAAVTLAASLIYVALEKISATHLLGMWLHYPAIALNVFAWVTLVFVAGEYFANRFHWSAAITPCSTKWDPRKLPMLKLTGKTGRASAGSNPRQDFFGACCGLLIILALANWANIVPFAATHGILFAPGWKFLYEVLLAATIASVAMSFVNMLRPDWTAIKPVTGLVTATAILFALGRFLQRSPWLIPTTPNHTTWTAVAALNVTTWWSIVCWAAGMAIGILVYAWQCVNLVRSTGKSAKMRPVLL